MFRQFGGGLLRSFTIALESSSSLYISVILDLNLHMTRFENKPQLQKKHLIIIIIYVPSSERMSLIPTLFGNRRSDTCDPFSMDIWAPFHGFPFSGPLNNSKGSAGGEVSAFAGARIDWKETPESHVLKADLPGLKKEEVKVEIEEGGVLQISGERSREQEEKNDKWHSVERSSGKFLRRFRLPEGAKVEEIKAAMENGVLTVTVPKEEIKKPQVKAIDISD